MVRSTRSIPIHTPRALRILLPRSVCTPASPVNAFSLALLCLLALAWAAPLRAASCDRAAESLDTCRQLIAQRNFAQARRLLGPLTTSDDTAIAAEARLLWAQIELAKRPSKGIKTLQRVAKTYAGGEAEGEARWLMADHHRGAGDLDQAASVLRALLKRKPDLMWTVNALELLGDIRHDRDGAAQAVDSYKAALDRGRTLPRGERGARRFP